MPRTVLVVDDNLINRQLLCNILAGDYAVAEAENGQQAVDVLMREHLKISAVLLDILMPVMDGYEVLKKMRGDPALSQIPVIVTTGSAEPETEQLALDLGANDVVQKPYDPVILKRRLQNLISLRESSALVNALQRDKLTGLWTREAFFERAGWEIRRAHNERFVLACLDVDDFKLINDQYGTETGDEVLRSIAHALRRDCEADGSLCGRISADNFVVLYKEHFLEREAGGAAPHSIADFGQFPFPVTISIGRYVITDRSLPVSAMFDRAKLAQSTVKGRSDLHIAVYDEQMRASLLRRQEITHELPAALAEGQFEVWLQPQYNHATGAMTGAEALARWRHPKKGFIPPGDFIPVLERSGSIYELDKYIWEQVCVLLRKWLDEGREPLPVSVNVSRSDLFRDDLAERLMELTVRYGIPTELLCLEITESAFAESTEQMVSVVKSLIGHGFTVEIDDFGSGYSSLNSLKDVPAQVLKLDMRFLGRSGDTNRGGSILESVVRMSKWLGMWVIAEGVEDREQADYLRSIGCYHIQGYYYARPMPAAEYEALAAHSHKARSGADVETVEHLDTSAFWDPASVDTLIFNSFVGGACIFEYSGGDRLELLRVNKKYAEALGGEAMTEQDAMGIDPTKHLDREGLALLMETAKKADRTSVEVSCELRLTEVTPTRPLVVLGVNLRAIARTGSRVLYYCLISDVTEQRETENKVRIFAQQLETIMANVNDGVAASIVKDGNVEFLFANDRYFSILGTGRETYGGLLGNGFQSIVPEDGAMVMASCEALNITGEPVSIEYRIRRSDGQLRWLKSRVTLMKYPGTKEPVQLSVTTDITDEERTQRDLLDNLPGGAGIYELKDGRMSLVYQNKSYWEMVGLGDIAYPDPAPMSAVHPEDVPVIMQALSAAIAQGKDVSCEVRLRHLERGYFPVHLAGRILPAEDGSLLIYASFTPLDPAASRSHEPEV